MLAQVLVHFIWGCFVEEGVCPWLEPKVGKGISPKSVRGPRRMQDRGDICGSLPLAHSFAVLEEEAEDE